MDETFIPPKTKRARNSDSENQENKDRLSDLPDCVLLHIFSFLKAKHAVRTCVLSTRWKDLWKGLPTLILHSSDFWTLKSFTKFVSRLLTLRDGSITLQGLDFDRVGSIEPHLLKRIVNYAVSHNVQRFGISVKGDICHIPPCIFSCQTVTSLKLSVSPKDDHYFGTTLFPKSLNLPALTSLHLQYFSFCASDNDSAEPFSTFNRLNSLIIDHCTLRDTLTLRISSTSLIDLTVHSNYSEDFFNIVLSTLNLSTFAFTGVPYQLLRGSNLSSIEQVNIDAEMRSNSSVSPLILLCWLLELANIKSLTVTASTLQVLFSIPDLLKMKLSILSNLKCLKVKLIEPLSYGFSMALRAAKLQKAAAKSQKEAAKLRKAFAAGVEPYSPIPDGIVDFLLQNSPSALVDIIDCSR